MIKEDTHTHTEHEHHSNSDNSCHPVSHGDHDGHGGHGDHAQMFKSKFLVSLLLTIPAVFYSHMMENLFNYMAPHFQGSHWVSPIFGTIVFIYGGPVFLKGGISEIKNKKPGMMLLISMGLLVALAASIATEFGWIDVDLWFELATLITVMLLGHWLEMKAIGQAQNALSKLAELLPDSAERITGEDIEEISIGDINVGDLVLVRSGGRIPADGIIEQGTADIDEAMVTGESAPIEKTIGAKVVAGTVATDSSIRIRITQTGDDTALAGIKRLVEEAQNSQSRAQALADRFAAMLFYVAMAAGVLTFTIWTLMGEINTGIERTVTVLIIACPHALGLAIPLTIAVATNISASAGILVKSRLALERMRKVDAVLFDKTGTLTFGKHSVKDAFAITMSKEELLSLSAAVESDSEHPLAKAIVEAGTKIGSLPKATNFESLSGRGVKASVDGNSIAIGGPSYLKEQSLSIPTEMNEKIQEWINQSISILYVIKDGVIIGAIALEDQMRPESVEAVKQLQEMNIDVIMLTGDAKQVADNVSKQLGISEVYAEILPGDKDRIVSEIQTSGRKVAMVGDGVNDAPALARADVGIAIGAGTDVAIESAGVVLASSDPRSVVGVIKLSKATYSKMIQNLVWGAGYNVIAIPLAAGVFTTFGLNLSPTTGAILMSASTVIVAFNAQLLRKLKLKQDAIG